MRAAAVALTLLLIGATPSELDSQYVLQRYAIQMAETNAPKVVVFGYTVSQAGLGNIEQRHVVYRSGLNVRDETLSVDGANSRQKIVRFEQREDRYAVGRIAPHADAYQLLFLHTVKDGSHLDYVYEATPLVKQGETWVDSVTLDGITFLPRVVRFQTSSAQTKASGAITYAPFGKYWMPVVASVTATVNGKPARERIAWTDYRFPPSLPPSTFTPPHALPEATLPPI